MVGVHVKQIFGCLGNILNQYFPSNQSSYSRPMWNEPSEQSSNSLPTWNGLPDVAVKKIFGQLKAGDRAKLMVVSKTWKRILCRDDLPIVPELWKLCSSSYVTHVKLASTSEGSRIYSFKVPEFYEDIPKSWICGLSNGWLVLTCGPKMDPDMVLWNPLNDDVMVLPRLSTLPFLHQLLKFGPEVYNISSYIKRVHVSSPECIVAVVFWDPDDGRKPDYLALCTPNDREWKVFQGDYIHSLSDILFHDGKLYALALAKETMDDDTYKKNTKFTKKVCLSKCQVEICVLCLDYKADDALGDGSFYYDEDIGSNPIFNVTCGDKKSEHLVEFSGQLLVVDVVYDLIAYNSNGDGPVETYRCHGIQRMEVRKVDGLENVDILGDDRIIALADTGSLMVPPSAIYQGEHDSGITFTTQFARGIVGDHDCDADSNYYSDGDDDSNYDSDCDADSNYYSDGDDDSNYDSDCNADSNYDSDGDDDGGDDSDGDDEGGADNHDDNNGDNDYDDDYEEIHCVAREFGFFHLESKQFHSSDVKYYKHPGLFISGWHTPKLF